MYELKKNGKVFTSKSVGTGPSSYEKRIYWAAVSQRLRNSAVENKVQARFDTSTVGTPSVMAETVFRNAARSVVIQQKHRHFL